MEHWYFYKIYCPSLWKTILALSWLVSINVIFSKGSVLPILVPPIEGPPIITSSTSPNSLTTTSSTSTPSTTSTSSTSLTESSHSQTLSTSPTEGTIEPPTSEEIVSTVRPSNTTFTTLTLQNALREFNLSNHSINTAKSITDGLRTCRINYDDISNIRKLLTFLNFVSLSKSYDLNISLAVLENINTILSLTAASLPENTKVQINYATYDMLLRKFLAKHISEIVVPLGKYKLYFDNTSKESLLKQVNENVSVSLLLIYIHLEEVHQSDSSSIINSNPFSLTLMVDLKKISIPVQFILENIQSPSEKTCTKHKDLQKCQEQWTSCAFWSESKLSWNTYGCEKRLSWMNQTTCYCNHTTTFAMIMQTKEFNIPELHKRVLKILTWVCCSISLASLMITMVVFVFLRVAFHSERATIHTCLCVCLICANAVFLFGINATSNKIPCTIVAALLHYIYLTVFMWMLIEGIHLYDKVVNVFTTEGRMKYYFLGAFGVPLIIVGVSLALKHNGFGTKIGCWLSIRNGLIWSFVGPALLIIFVNFCILVTVIKVVVRSAQGDTQNNYIDRIKSGVRAALVLLPILGLTWLFGAFSIDQDTMIFQYIFSILNALQGFFIFLVHCIFCAEVRQEWVRRRRRSSSINVGDLSVRKCSQTSSLRSPIHTFNTNFNFKQVPTSLYTTHAPTPEPTPIS